RFSILPALSCNGIEALSVFPGSVTKELFVSFLETQVVPLLSPFPGPRSVVVLDNCAIHHDAEIRHIVETLCSA
ncbi:hypothetical protein CYLTODRAFT_326077, partial [Cylindrobasidium torrendii FP15055 ss-10]